MAAAHRDHRKPMGRIKEGIMGQEALSVTSPRRPDSYENSQGQEGCRCQAQAGAG